MTGALDVDGTEAADEGGLDPREAAALLELTRRQAQRQLDMRPPLLSLLGAVVALLAYGAVWLSVRGQHPYVGPSLGALEFLYTLLAVWIAAVTTVARRATAGVSGRSVRRQRAEAAAVGVALVAVYVLQGALRVDGASSAIVYGVYPAVAPLIVLGAAAASRAAAHDDWPELGIGIACIAVGAGSAFAGPVWVWLFCGVGTCIAVLGYGIAKLRVPRTPR
ncbi:MAG TPA: hypothetical protein VF112_08050 [Candidatus Dormibacteraeota bacterium]